MSKENTTLLIQIINNYTAYVISDVADCQIHRTEETNRFTKQLAKIQS